MSFTVAYYIDSQAFGGAEQVLFNLLTKLDRDVWHPVLVYHPSEGITGFVERVKGLGVETLSLPRIRNIRDVSGLKHFSAGLRSIRPRIFHANLNWILSCTYGITAAFLSGVKTIVATQHLYGEMETRRETVIQRFISLVVDRYIAVSNDIARQLKEDIFFSSKVDVVHNGILTSDFASTDLRSDYSEQMRREEGKQTRGIILTAARLTEQKGHQYLLKAIPFITGPLFLFAGDGPARDDIEREIKELNIGDRVRVLGYRNDIPELLSRCSIFVLPSLFEGHPLSIMEAMAAGKPVIASDIRGVDEIIVNGVSGYLVPPRNPEALASAIRTLLEDKELSGRIAEAGRRRIENEFSADTMTNKVTGIYEDLIAQGMNFPAD